MSRKITQTVKEINRSPELKPLHDLNEEAVKQAVVVPMLEAAGWNSRRVKTEFVTEYGVTSAGNERVDYSLRIASSNRVFVEAKNASEDLHDYSRQLLNYCLSANDPPDIGVLTNGRLWWLYSPTPGSRGGWKKPRQFCTIDIMSDKPGEVRKKFRFLSKDNVESGAALRAAGVEYGKLLRNEETKEAVVQAWNQIVQQPEEGLIDLITGVTEHICSHNPDPNMVRTFLREHIDRFVVMEEPVKLEEDAGRRRFDPTGKKPFEVELNGQVRGVNGWPGVLREMCILIYDELDEKESFERVLTIEGSKNPYFSKDGSNLHNSEWIEHVGYYVERSGIGSSVVMSICEQALHRFGYPSGSLEIRARASVTQALYNVRLPR